MTQTQSADDQRALTSSATRNEPRDPTRKQKLIYWSATIVLASGLVGSGVQQLLRVEVVGALAPAYGWGMEQLGYPAHLLTILGVWKLLGAAAIVAPRFPLLKEWAYAGIFFLLTGAMFSHAASGHAWYQQLPALFLLIITVLSWWYRPADRMTAGSTRRA